VGRFEVQHTPKHGSWLNMAEIEIGVLSRQCQARRIPDRETLEREVACRLEGAAQRRGDARRLAIQDRRRSSEAEVALPNNSMLKEY